MFSSPLNLSELGQEGPIDEEGATEIFTSERAIRMQSSDLGTTESLVSFGNILNLIWVHPYDHSGDLYNTSNFSKMTPLSQKKHYHVYISHSQPSAPSSFKFAPDSPSALRVTAYLQETSKWLGNIARNLAALCSTRCRRSRTFSIPDA